MASGPTDRAGTHSAGHAKPVADLRPVNVPLAKLGGTDEAKVISYPSLVADKIHSTTDAAVL